MTLTRPMMAGQRTPSWLSWAGVPASAQVGQAVTPSQSLPHTPVGGDAPFTVEAARVEAREDDVVHGPFGDKGPGSLHLSGGQPNRRTTVAGGARRRRVPPSTYVRDAKGTTVGCRALGASLAVSVVAVAGALSVEAPVAQAKNGDTHVTGQGITQTLDCNDSTLIIVGTGNTVTAVGTCWGVSVQGSSNIVVADTVVNDITVYGFDQTVLYHGGEPAVWDRGRELGMTNRIDRVPV